MNKNDLIYVDVVASNPQTRTQRPVLYRFNGAGEQITEQGDAIKGPGLGGDWPVEGSSKSPVFPAEEYKRLHKEGTTESKAKAQKLLAEYSSAVQKTQGKGSEEMVVVDRVMDFLKDYEHIQEEAGEHFRLQRKDLVVTRTPLKDGRMLIRLSGAAVFGR